MVHAVQDLVCQPKSHVDSITTYHTHALPSRKQGGNTNEESEEGERPPATVCGAEGDYNGINNAAHYSAHSKSASECLSRWVTIADCPADEVGMGLVAEGPFNRGNDIPECGRMSGNRECLEKHGFLLG